MDWANPYLLLLILPVALLILWAQRRSQHPMTASRRRWLTAVRIVGAALVLLALADPAWKEVTTEQTVLFVLDHSKSQGEGGLKAAYARANELMAALPEDAQAGFLSVGQGTHVLRPPSKKKLPLELDTSLIEKDGAQTNLAGAVALAQGLYPPGTARRLVLLSDGLETRGDLLRAAREATLKEIVIDAVPIRGPARPDARVVRLRSSRARSHEGATISLAAEVETSLAGKGRLRLFENGVEVETKALVLEVGKPRTVEFKRTPEQRNLYRYLVRLEGFGDDAIVENNEAMTLVEVRGRPLLLYVEGMPDEAHYLAQAMAKEGIRLDVRPPEGIPENLQQLAGYDGIILSDIPARMLTERRMSLIHDYVEKLGGGFLMVGGINSFGVGGYYRTPIEDLLPVKMQPPDVEEKFSTALCLVIDRSGSMSGQKIEICKSAAIATADMLTSKDFLGVVAFDSRATWVVPMMRAGNKAEIQSRIATLNAGGGTHIYPGMTAGYEGLRRVSAKVKHMIVLTDGQTSGSGYTQLAGQMLAEGITVSSVAVGSGAAVTLLRSIAQAGGGKFYETLDPSSIPRIFTQDTAVHMGRLVREESFKPVQNERHPMLAGWDAGAAPALLGYVKTIKKATTQVPLVTDIGDPLLAHWRFGLGKVTAFTSDCKSRWAALWISGWDGYGQFWGQVLREMARNPQGQYMDIRLREAGQGTRIEVDVLEDAAQFRNAARVEVDVYFVPAGALGRQMKHTKRLVLDQSGPGRYGGLFHPEKPGVYLIRARAGSDMVSAGFVHNVSSEQAVGWVDTKTLEKVTKVSGGSLLEAGDTVATNQEGIARYVDLAPWILRLLLLLFLVDLLLRRWENVLGVRDALQDLFGGPAGSSGNGSGAGSGGSTPAPTPEATTAA